MKRTSRQKGNVKGKRKKRSGKSQAIENQGSQVNHSENVDTNYSKGKIDRKSLTYYTSNNVIRTTVGNKYLLYKKVRYAQAHGGASSNTMGNEHREHNRQMNLTKEREPRSFWERRDNLKNQYRKWREVDGESGWTPYCGRVWGLAGKICTANISHPSKQTKHRATIGKATASRVKAANANTYSSAKPSQIHQSIGDENIFSLEHINVNGLSTRNGMVEVENFFGIMQDMEASVFGVAEHTLDVAQPVVKKLVRDTSKKVDKYAKLEMGTCSTETAEYHWKPGGTMIGVSGRWSSRVMGQGSDELGRWSWVDLRGKGAKVIRIYSAYRVSQEKVTHAGVLTACQQQYRALVKAEHKVLSPKQAFLADLEHELTLWGKNDKHETIVMLDSNETLAEGKEFKAFTENVHLTDAMETLDPSLLEDPTYLWGKRRIDYILLSQGVVGAAIKGGHHPFHQYVVSDHKGVYVHFDARELFAVGTADLSHISQRKILLSHRDIVLKYITKLESLYKEHRIMPRLDKIRLQIERASTDEHRKCLFNKLDKLDVERVRLMVAAEKYAGRAPPKGTYAWSPLLEKVGQTITYWKMRLTVVQEGYVNPARLERLQKRLKIKNVDINNKKAVMSKLKQAWKDLR